MKKSCHNMLLLHGASMGGWSWDKVTPTLQQHGFNVLTPTLPGHAERENELSSDINFDSYIQAILIAIKAFTSDPIILVGHSFSGTIITKIASLIPQQIAQLVYIDALVPINGKSALALQTQAVQDQYFALVKTRGEGWYLPIFEGL